MDDERPAHAPNLSASEEMILGWIRDGLVDAEIAVRLGVNNGDVKERIERLVSRMGVRDRAALRASAEPTPDESSEPEVDPSEAVELRPSRWRLSPAVLLIVLALGGGIAFAASQGGEQPKDYGRPGDSLIEQAYRDARFSAIRLNPAIVELLTPKPPEAAPPRPVTLLRNGQGFLDMGRLFFVDGHPTGIGSVEHLAGKARVTLGGGQGIFRFENGSTEWNEWIVSPTERKFTFGGGPTIYTLHIDRADAETDFLLGDWDSFGIFSRGSGPPVVTVWVEGHAVEVGDDGHLYVGVEPVD